ncbi:MAG: DNA replication/repair protein RecF [Gammaproteobacteria bacterium]|jgi:DNA replication and repair protein RecF|nr:DNA replication/repair protein RecF [Gammaproteobacteria bacterium]
MAIRQLSLTDFRNLRSTTLDFDPHVNLIFGENASGKTSLLEAIYVLCQADSFRSHQLRQCVNHGKSGFLLFGRFADFKAGLAKSSKKLEIHVNGEVIRRRSELVRRVPVQIVNAHSFELIDGSPQQRRGFLDWCLFHVEQSYAEIWGELRHALKQRNRLLKSRRDLKLLDYWDDHLVSPSAKLYEMRCRQCDALRDLLATEFSDLLHDIPIEIEYRRGWPEGVELKDALVAQRQRDVQSGFTNSGLHRDDLIFTTNGIRTSAVLSRGQGKRLCMALLMASLQLVNRITGKRIILLVDDLQSELDSEAQQRVYQKLEAMDLQLFISNIGARPPAGLAKDFKMFHVEHGTIKPRIFS